MVKLFPTGLLLLALSSGPSMAAGAPAAVSSYAPGPGGPDAMPPENGYGMAGPGARQYGADPAAVPPVPPPFAGMQFSGEQRKRIDAMMNREREAHQQRIERMHKAQAKLQQLYQADVWDTGAITAVYDEIFAEQRNTIKAMAEARNSVFALLSEEQRAQMKQNELQMRRFGAMPRQ